MSSSRERGAFQFTGRDDSPAPPLRKTLASDDFFTDSLLDSSRIPTPSPSKKQVFASKPRRAIGNTRTLKAAWDATATSGQALSLGNDPHSVKESFKPAPAQASRRIPTNQPNSQATPSPPRGRQTSLPIASPTSDASSPPRGLNDVYQRIADEERLAAQEGEIEENDFTDSTMSQDDYMSDDKAQLNRMRTSQSPLNIRSSSKGTPRLQAEDADKENQGQDMGLTEASGLSFLESLTDQGLAAKLTPHTLDRARDRARLDKAIQKTTPLAFSKAQVGSKHALTAENLQRSSRRNNAESMHSSSNGSLPNEDITPPPNVPRTWGSKGRVDRDWLRKIRDRNGSPANGTPNASKQESSQVDWTAAAAEIPLPSVEDSLTPRPEEPRNSTPISLSKRTSLDKVSLWELNDFTGNNLQVSNSPPVKVRTTVPDHFRHREIESLEKQAVTTNRLGEIRKKNSLELLTSKSRSSSVGAQKEVGQASADKNADIPRIDEEGEPIPDTPIVVYKASANGSKEEISKTRPLHDRKDSRDSLQRLARAISDSPRPSSTPEDWSLIREEEVESATPEDSKSEKRRDTSRKSSKEVASVNPPPLIKRSKSTDAARTPIVTGAWTDTILPDTVRTVKQGRAQPRYAQTPHVTGGWINTPAATGKRQSSALAPIPTKELQGELADDPKKEDLKTEEKGDVDPQSVTKPASVIPRSALSSLLTKAKRKLAAPDRQHSPIEEETNNNDTLNLGDATIESLEDFLTLDNADMTTLIRMGAEFEAREKTAGKEGEKAADGTETELLERLGTKLERLRTNIHDARKGISKLEHQVSQPQSPQTQGGTSGSGQLGIVGTCQTCGCSHAGTPSSFPFDLADPSNRNPASNLFLAIPFPRHIPIPRLWHPPRKDPQYQQWLPRPTPIGWITLVVWLWYLSESIMCGLYCHPEYAEFYVWPDCGEQGGGRYCEPEWGWALWTVVVKRWLRGASVWRALLWAVRVGAWVLGLGDGFEDRAIGAGRMNLTRTAAGDGGGSYASGTGWGSEDEVLGLHEDEYL